MKKTIGRSNAVAILVPALLAALAALAPLALKRLETEAGGNEARLGAGEARAATAPADHAVRADQSSPDEEAPVSPPPSPEAADPRKIFAPALAPVEAGLVENGDRGRPLVAITFDACEGENPAGFDRAVWDVLVAKRAAATVFMGGKWMESHPRETLMMADNPLIEIGNHSYIHPDFRSISDERKLEEIRRTQDIQYRLTGRQGALFRFPFGYYDDRSLALVAECGLYPIQWDVVSGDPSRSVKAGPMAREVLARARNGSIIIFHINGRGWDTHKALPEIIDGLRRRGFTLVTVSELMGYQPPTAPRPPQTGEPPGARPY